MKSFLLLMVAWSAFANVPIYLEELSSGRLATVDLSGTTLVTFIRPGCVPCKHQLQALQCVQEKGSSGRILAVQSSGDSAELTRSLKPLKLGFPVLRGTESFLTQFEAMETPTPLTLVVRDGKVLNRILGAQQCSYWARVLKE